MLSALSIIKMKENSIQIIAMSATFLRGQARLLQSWIGGALFVQSERIQPIKEHIIYSNGSTIELLSLSSIKHRQHKLQLIPSKSQAKAPLHAPCLVTNNTNSAAPSICVAQAHASPRSSMMKVSESRPELINLTLNSLEKRISKSSSFVLRKTKCVILQCFSQTSSTIHMNSKLNKLANALNEECGSTKVGGVDIHCICSARIGIHKADMTSMSRFLMERAFKEGYIKLLVATSTIARGVNFPVDCVIMYGVHSFFSENGLISLEDYLQKIGRAGRLEFKENGGESYIFASSEKEFKHAKSLLLREVEPASVTGAQSEAASSYFKDSGAFHRFLLVNVVSHLTQQKAFLSFHQL